MNGEAWCAKDRNSLMEQFDRKLGVLFLALRPKQCPQGPGKASPFSCAYLPECLLLYRNRNEGMMRRTVLGIATTMAATMLAACWVAMLAEE